MTEQLNPNIEERYWKGITWQEYRDLHIVQCKAKPRKKVGCRKGKGTGIRAGKYKCAYGHWREYQKWLKLNIN